MDIQGIDSAELTTVVKLWNREGGQPHVGPLTLSESGAIMMKPAWNSLYKSYEELANFELRLAFERKSDFLRFYYDSYYDFTWKYLRTS